MTRVGSQSHRKKKVQTVLLLGKVQTKITNSYVHYTVHTSCDYASSSVSQGYVTSCIMSPGYDLDSSKLTLRSRVLHEKLTVPQPVKKFPTFYETRRFITAFTSARHLFLS